jgi:hypothetical protein
MKLFKKIATAVTEMSVHFVPSGERFDSLVLVAETGIVTVTDSADQTEYTIGGEANPLVLNLNFNASRDGSEFTAASSAGGSVYGFYRIAGKPSAVYHSQELKAETAFYNLLSDRSEEIIVPIEKGLTSDEMDHSCVVVTAPSGTPTSDLRQGKWDVEVVIKVFTVQKGNAYNTHVARVGMVRGILFRKDLEDLLTDSVAQFTVLGMPKPGRTTNTIKGRCWMTETTFSVPCVGTDLT